MSPGAPSLLVQTLCVTDAVYGYIARANALAVQGHKDDAMAALANLAEQVEAHRPILRSVIEGIAETSAKLKAAKALDTTQGTVARILRREAAEHRNPANDHGPASPEPTPSIA